MTVGILGGGRWGQALARLVLAAGHQPLIAFRGTRRPPHILPSTDKPPEVSAAAELLLVATSAAQVRNAIQLARPGPRHRVVVAGRGLEPDTARWLTDVVLEESRVLRVGALAGPAPSDEILNGGLGAGVVASPFQEVRELATRALHSQRYRLYDSDDLMGVQLAGAMTPVLATLLGVARGLQGSGVGMYAMVLARGLSEAGRLATALGADPRTLSGLAGVGDLVAAHAVEGHPNYEAGVAISKGLPGARERGPAGVARALVRIATAVNTDLPLTQALCDIYGGLHPLQAVEALMARPAHSELD